MEDAYLGVDGGGTQTRAILVDASGRVLGIGRADGSNYHNIGVQDATRNVLVAIRDAWRDADQCARPAAKAFLGLAAIKSDRDRITMQASLETSELAGVGDILVANDLHNALTAAHREAEGIAVIAGTGSNCLGRNASGEALLCGGWGWLLDDCGSAFWIGLEGLRAAVKAADGRQAFTEILPAALAFLGLETIDDILARIYVDGWKPDEIAAFARVVARLAAEGDSVAGDILHRGSVALAELIATTSRALSPTAPLPFALFGGCLENLSSYRTAVAREVEQQIPGARLVETVHSPLHGAAWNALRMAGVSPLPALAIHEKA